jgi:hypothetical protein
MLFLFPFCLIKLTVGGSPAVLLLKKVNARTQSLICHPCSFLSRTRRVAYHCINEREQNPTSSHFSRTKGLQLQLRFRKKNTITGNKKNTTRERLLKLTPQPYQDLGSGVYGSSKFPKFQILQEEAP